MYPSFTLIVRYSLTKKHLKKKIISIFKLLLFCFVVLQFAFRLNNVLIFLSLLFKFHSNNIYYHLLEVISYKTSEVILPSSPYSAKLSNVIDQYIQFHFPSGDSRCRLKEIIFLQCTKIAFLLIKSCDLFEHSDSVLDCVICSHFFYKSLFIVL